MYRSPFDIYRLCQEEKALMWKIKAEHAALFVLAPTQSMNGMMAQMRLSL